MNTKQFKLQWLQSAPIEPAPFGYDEFEARIADRAAQLRMRKVAAAGVGAALAAVFMLAVVWRAQQEPTALDLARQTQAAPVDLREVLRADGPALVSADTYVAVTALEDRLAWFDDALSEARVIAGTGTGASTEQLRQLEHERERLAQSLVQVKYAAELSAAM